MEIPSSCVAGEALDNAARKDIHSETTCQAVLGSSTVVLSEDREMDILENHQMCGHVFFLGICGPYVFETSIDDYVTTRILDPTYNLKLAST